MLIDRLDVDVFCCSLPLLYISFCLLYLYYQEPHSTEKICASVIKTKCFMPVTVKVSIDTISFSLRMSNILGAHK